MRHEIAPIAVVLCLAGCASRTAPLESEAIRLYDQGQYAEARAVLEQLDAAGDASGPMLYRLHYCLQATGADGASATLARAAELLEAELAESRGLEVPFYLSNAYQNLARGDDALRVAQQTTARVESGDLATPSEPVEMFRLGKLYADQGRGPEATRWYTASLDAFAAAGSDGGPYLPWASRYLAEPAFQSGDYAGAARYYGALAASGQPSATDLDRLAVAQCRIGRFADAVTSWERAATIERADPDQFRYSSRLAALAADAGGIPPAAPDGRAWSALTKAELNAILVERVQLARQALGEARGSELESPTPERLAELKAEIRKAQAEFAAAGLEFAIARHGIREAAFFGGYARMIFQKQEWHVGGRGRGGGGGLRRGE